MSARKSYIEIGWKINRDGLVEAKRETDQLANGERQVGQVGKEANDQLQTSLHKTKSETNESTTSFAEMRRELDRNKSSISLTKKEHDSYINRLQAEGRTTDAQKVKNASLKTSYSELNDQLKKETDYLHKVADASGKNSDAYRRQSIRVNDLRTDIAKTKDKMQLMNDTSEHTSGSFGKLKNAGNGLINMGNNLAMVMLPVAAAFKKSADEATNLQNKYTTIKNLLNTGGESSGASAAETKAMEKENNRFALQYGVSPEDMAKGGEELVRRGYSGKQELASHKSFLQAARASGDDYNSVVGYGAPVLEQFGYKTKAGNSVKKMKKYTDMVLNQMAYGADLTATDFTGMGNAMRYVGATAKSSDQGLARTVAGVGVLSNNGQDGSVAGTGLRKVLNAFAAPNTSAKSQQGQIMSSLGLKPEDFVKANGQVKSLADNMDILRKATEGMSDSQKMNVFHMFFGTTGQESGLILANNTKQLRSLTNQVGKAQEYGKHGYIADLAQKNMKSWQNQIAKFNQYMNIMGLGFTKTVLPAFTKGLGIANKFLDVLIKLPSPIKKIVGEATALASVWAVFKVGKGILSYPSELLNAVRGRGEVSNAAQIANTESGVVGNDLSEIGSRSGSIHYSGIRGNVRNWMSDTQLGGAVKGYGYFQLADQGISLASNISTMITKGISSGQGAKAAWQTGGQLVGGGIGAFLGGPAGAGIGAQIGGSIGKAFGSSKYVKNIEHGGSINPTDNSRTTPGNAGAALSGGDAAVAANSLGDQQARAAYRAKHGKPNIGDSGRGSAYKATSVKNAVTSWNYASLSKANRSYIKQAVSLEQQGNIAWAESAGKTSRKLKTTYSSLYQLANKQANKELSDHQKRLQYLEKEGIISKSTEASEYNSDKTYYQKRLASLKSNLNSIENDENLSGKKRKALINKINDQIIALTDKGSQKQKSIMASLMNRTRSLTTQGYAKIITASNKNYQITTRNAQKTYDATVSSANKRYRKEKAYAKDEYGLNTKRYKNAVAAAEKQRAGVIKKADDQYNSAVKYAEKQRKDVVAAAKKEAGQAADAFSTAAQNIGKSIPALITNNVKAGIQSYSNKFNSSDFTKNMAANNRHGGALPASSPNNKTFKAHNANKIKLATGFASGGPIHRTQNAIVNEGGQEIAYNPSTGRFRFLGNGPSLAKVFAGEHILNARDTAKLLHGGLGAGRTLKGYASGTTSLKSSSTSIGLSGVSFSDTQTKKSANKIGKDISDSYVTATKKSKKAIDKFNDQSGKSWKSIHQNTNKETQKLQKDTVGNYDDMQKGTNKQMGKMHSQVVSNAKNIVSDFGSIMGKLDNYAHSAMANAITQLNKGFKSLNVVFSQFGGKSSTLKLAHYATGTGPINHDQLAVINDSKNGPHEEAVIRGNQATMYKGHDIIAPLRKGDEVLNGHEVAGLKQDGILPHFAKGTGALKRLITANNNHPNKAFANDFTNRINQTGVQLAKGIIGTAKAGSTSAGDKWNGAAWSALSNAMSGGGSGAGGSWRHTPGLSETNGFGAPRSFGKHDGVDFSGPMGSSILAVHGGKVTHTGRPLHGWPYSQLGDVITVHSDDGFDVIYQEFGGMSNIKVHSGETIKPGQRVATLGALNGAGSGSHVHIGAAKGSVWDQNGATTAGWYDVTKMHGVSHAKDKSSKKESNLDKLVNHQLASQIKWVGKHLSDDIGAFGLSGSIGKRAKTLADAIKRLYPSATNKGIAAVLGNWEFESGLNPGAINPGGGASGLGQWLGGRKDNLISFARRHHQNWKNAGAQLAFAIRGEGSDSALLRSILRGNGSVSALANRFSSGWERGGYNAQHVNGARKIEAALGFAKGGRPPLHQTVKVGEDGPELAEFEQPVHIYSNQQSKQKLNAAHGGKSGFSIKIDKIEVKANSAKEGRAAADSFNDRLLKLFYGEQDNFDFGG
ncbi:phage tail tape measure protein [Lentilactobacillus parabuchneri]|uniref:phage tail tape measure protein n=1 Tax=Lentilactobacillus parabuchneri TaxID=152331 RepID=UPI00230723E3|nr:phage tail tape measure protein [Lentilactobacillus parabuchneri]MDB1104635.1 phage tail tape measure protein [Lentilactobacillus parabuchneri]